MKYLTIKHMMKAAKSFPYLLCLTNYGRVAINSRFVELMHKQGKKGTIIFSYLPCDFQTYISFKIGFLSQPIKP